MRKKPIVLIFILCTVLFCSGCSYWVREVKYYSQRDNYVNAVGTVTHIAYSEDNMELCLGFSELTPTFDDTDFEIVGENLRIAQDNGIDTKIKIGDQVEFITAPRYFYDGYIMPIVAISVNGECLLEFEEGFGNFFKWIMKHGG